MLNIFAALVCIAVAVAAVEQHACVYGQLRCSTDSMPETSDVTMNAKIQMFDFDWGIPDDDMGEFSGDPVTGLFGHCGTAEDWYGKIDPYIQIQHKCKAKPGCTKVMHLRIPTNQIPRGKEPAKKQIIRGMGVIDLAQEDNQPDKCLTIE